MHVDTILCNFEGYLQGHVIQERTSDLEGEVFLVRNFPSSFSLATFKQDFLKVVN